MGAWALLEARGRRQRCPSLHKSVYLSRLVEEAEHRPLERCNRRVSELGACLRGPRGGPRTETDSRRLGPWPARRGGHRAAVGTERRAPIEAAARAPER